MATVQRVLRVRPKARHRSVSSTLNPGALDPLHSLPHTRWSTIQIKHLQLDFCGGKESSSTGQPLTSCPACLLSHGHFRPTLDGVSHTASGIQGTVVSYCALFTLPHIMSLFLGIPLTTHWLFTPRGCTEAAQVLMEWQPLPGPRGHRGECCSAREAQHGAV